MTGFANFEASMGAKWLELLKEVAPKVSRVAVLIDTGIASHLEFLHAAQDAAPKVGVQVIGANVHDRSEVERVITAATAEGDDGLMVLPDPIFNIDCKLDRSFSAASDLSIPILHASGRAGVLRN